jgi:hypothetical protein
MWRGHASSRDALGRDTPSVCAPFITHPSVSHSALPPARSLKKSRKSESSSKRSRRRAAAAFRCLSPSSSKRCATRSTRRARGTACWPIAARCSPASRSIMRVARLRVPSQRPCSSSWTRPRRSSSMTTRPPTRCSTLSVAEDGVFCLLLLSWPRYF